jgi:GT2 family glycosyltransferase
MTSIKLFVIIVTYNGKQWYDRCFESLRTSEFPIQTVVIDNASSDDTVNYIRTNFPEIHLIASNTNLGFGQGNNSGIRYALENGADYVFLLNQDAWIVEPGIFTKLIDVSNRYKEYAVISPQQLYGSGLQIANGIQQHFVDGQTTESDLMSDLFFERALKDLYDVPYVCAASWLLSKDILNSIGGFDPIFFHYGEDDNYLQRIFYHGYKVGVCPLVSVCHDVEFRKNGYGSLHQNWKKDLLLELTDINKKINLVDERRNYLKKSIVQFILLNTQKAKYNYNVYKFIQELSNEINYSRELNKTLKRNWL